MESIRAGQRVRKLLIDSSWRESDPELRELLAAAAARHVVVERVPRARLDTVHRRHQGVVAEVEPFKYTPWKDLMERVATEGEHALVLVLDELQDPQNLGSLLRTALAVGATGVVIPEHRAVGVTPAVARVSAGASEHLAVTQVPNLARALDDLKHAGLWIVGLDSHGGDPYDTVKLHGPLGVVVGSEGSGLRRLIREHCDFVVHLPMVGPTESLNAAVAGSIVLYHVFRSRDQAQRVASPAPAEQ